jgi:hypothetical protein
MSVQDWHLEVEEQGESGERVLISMKHRLQRTLDEHADAGRHYDWVLLLGGINDLGGGFKSLKVMLACCVCRGRLEHMKWMHAAAAGAQACCCGSTV